VKTTATTKPPVVGNGSVRSRRGCRGIPGQVAGPTKRLEPFLENLRPWQVKKIYYFPDAEREDIFRGKGPEYSVKDLSKLSKQPYWRMALDSFRSHQTQAKSFLDTLAQMDEAQIEKIATSDGGWTDAQHFVLGKSLVGGSVSGDIFEALRQQQFPLPGRNSCPSLRGQICRWSWTALGVITPSFGARMDSRNYRIRNRWRLRFKLPARS